jgi:hypothetical protein
LKNAVYFTDHAVAVNVRTDDADFLNGDLGWTAPAAGSVHQGYGAIKPRAAFGVDPLTGKGRSVKVADIAAALWTGGATAFVKGGVTYDVTSRRGELLHLTR